MPKIKGPFGYWDFPILNSIGGDSGYSHQNSYSYEKSYQMVRPDHEVERIRNQAISNWRDIGATENQINMALRMAEDWTNGIRDFVQRMTGSPLTEASYANTYRQGIAVADRWLRTMRTQMLGK